MIAPQDLLTYEQASAEFGLTVAQLRYLAKRGKIGRYTRGPLRGVYVSRTEVQQAITAQPFIPQDDKDK